MSSSLRVKPSLNVNQVQAEVAPKGKKRKRSNEAERLRDVWSSTPVETLPSTNRKHKTRRVQNLTPQAQPSAPAEDSAPQAPQRIARRSKPFAVAASAEAPQQPAPRARSASREEAPRDEEPSMREELDNLRNLLEQAEAQISDRRGSLADAGEPTESLSSSGVAGGEGESDVVIDITEPKEMEVTSPKADKPAEKPSADPVDVHAHDSDTEDTPAARRRHKSCHRRVAEFALGAGAAYGVAKGAGYAAAMLI